MMKEVLQLNVLRKVSLIKIPKINFYSDKNEPYHFDFIIMELINGKPISQTIFLSRKVKDNVSNTIIDNLLSYHNIMVIIMVKSWVVSFSSWKNCYISYVDKVLYNLNEFSYCDANIIYDKNSSIKSDFSHLLEGDIKHSLLYGDCYT